MKKILLTGIVALSIFASEAQTSKAKKTTKKPVNKEARAEAEFAKVQKEKQAARDLDRLDRLQADSIRIEEERLADSLFTSERMAWRDSMLRGIDSSNHVKWAYQMASREDWTESDRSRSALLKEAKLNESQGRQVKMINELYNDRARAIRDNAELTQEEKKAQYITLNNERVEKVKAVVGSAKYKKLDKEYKEFSKKNKLPKDEFWIAEANGYVTN